MGAALTVGGVSWWDALVLGVPTDSEVSALANGGEGGRCRFKLGEVTNDRGRCGRRYVACNSVNVENSAAASGGVAFGVRAGVLEAESAGHVLHVGQKHVDVGSTIHYDACAVGEVTGAVVLEKSDQVAGSGGVASVCACETDTIRGVSADERVLTLSDATECLHVRVAMEHHNRRSSILHLNVPNYRCGRVVFVVFARVGNLHSAHLRVDSTLGGDRSGQRHGIKRTILEHRVVEIYTQGSWVSVVRTALHHVVVMAIDGVATGDRDLAGVKCGGECICFVEHTLGTVGSISVERKVSAASLTLQEHRSYATHGLLLLALLTAVFRGDSSHLLDHRAPAQSFLKLAALLLAVNKRRVRVDHGDHPREGGVVIFAAVAEHAGVVVDGEGERVRTKQVGVEQSLGDGGAVGYDSGCTHRVRSRVTKRTMLAN
jgi:hypothetical protein